MADDLNAAIKDAKEATNEVAAAVENYYKFIGVPGQREQDAGRAMRFQLDALVAITRGLEAIASSTGQKPEQSPTPTVTRAVQKKPPKPRPPSRTAVRRPGKR